MCAARGGHTAVMKKLLTRQDLNINMKDKVHSVSLHTIQSARGMRLFLDPIYIPHVIAHIMFIKGNVTQLASLAFMKLIGLYITMITAVYKYTAVIIVYNV